MSTAETYETDWDFPSLESAFRELDGKTEADYSNCLKVLVDLSVDSVDALVDDETSQTAFDQVLIHLRLAREALKQLAIDLLGAGDDTEPNEVIFMSPSFRCHFQFSF